MKKIIGTLTGLLLYMQLAASLSYPYVDTNGYRYTDENTIQNNRKIAILSYGSLVRQKNNRRTLARLEATQFKPTEFYLPVSLSHQSQTNRLTAIIDRNGDPKRVWVATSQFSFLPNACNNLAAREGSRYLGQHKGYDLTNTFYMKKLLHNQTKNRNEKIIPSTSWVIRLPKHKHQRSLELPEDSAHNVATWADSKGYTAVIWASFPPNIASQEEMIQKLIHSNTLLTNTQDYIRNLPDGPQSEFEQAVIAGKEALRSFLCDPIENT
jgi:hypothetical protein